MHDDKLMSRIFIAGIYAVALYTFNIQYLSISFTYTFLAVDALAQWQTLAPRKSPVRSNWPNLIIPHNVIRARHAARRNWNAGIGAHCQLCHRRFQVSAVLSLEKVTNICIHCSVSNWLQVHPASSSVHTNLVVQPVSSLAEGDPCDHKDNMPIRQNTI